MKIFSACLATETNTFSPIPTGQNDFFTVLNDDIVIGAHNFDEIPPFALWHKKALARGDEFIFSLFAFAQPSGLTTKTAYQTLRDEVLTELQIAGPVDIVLLYLHGAMVANGYDDCEGDLLYKVRSIVGPEVVIAVELDLHCHLSEQMLKQSDIIITFKEYPHVDIDARAEELFNLAIDTQQKKCGPTMAMYDCHMMGMYPTTTREMRGFIAAMTEAEQQEGVLSVSFAHGFPFGDVPEAGGKILVVTDNNIPLAKSLAKTLGRQVFALRHGIGFPTLPQEEAMTRATSAIALRGCSTTANESEQKPVVIADQSDNPGGGAPGDATYTLAWLLEHHIQNVGMAIFYDPQVVRLAQAAGEGAQLSIRFGGKLGVTSGSPLDIDVTVGMIKENYQHRFPQIDPATCQESKPVYWPVGDTVALHCQGIDLIVSSERSQCFSPCIFGDFGITAKEKSLLVVKSIQHFYGAFAPIASEVIYMAAPGAVPPIVQQIPYKRVNTGDMYPWIDSPLL
ncbi:M81 family metallopeptidase [SAR92 clade bacterium H231]|nr:M81 family metallopeptidase [SAR92 clade bacterium H231]